LAAEIEFEYERASDSLIIHQYDIKSVKEEVCYRVETNRILSFMFLCIGLETLLARFTIFSVSKSKFVGYECARGYASFLCKGITICYIGKVYNFESRSGQANTHLLFYFLFYRIG
jgi:hypothetical protein